MLYLNFIMNNEFVINAVGYVRCSTDMQDDSISQQKNEIQNFAQKNHLKIKRWYEDEGKSGTTFLNRPAFFNLKNDVENIADFKYILVYDESRWGRAKDPRDSTYWKHHFRMHGVIVRIINSQSKQEDDVSSRIIEVMESEEASEYSKKLSRATLRGQIANATNGYSNGGTAPYGYKRVAINKSNNLISRDLQPGQRSHDDEKVIFEPGELSEIEIVKKIFDLKLNGLGYKRIATILNEENVPCPKRGRWKNKDQKWSANTLNTIISNPIYTGTRIFNRHPQSHLSGNSKEKWFNDKSEWTIKKDAHPAIIDEELFNQVNNSRKPYSRKNRFFYESSYLLSGILKCKNCGYNFQGQTRKLISKKSSETYYIRYYEDSGYINKGRAVCKSHLIRKEEIESYIIKQISSLIKDENFLNKVFKEIESKLLNDSEIDALLSNHLIQIDDNRTNLKNMLNLLRNGVNLQEVQDEIYRINKEIEHYQKSYDELKHKKTTNDDIQKITEKIKVLMDEFENTFASAPVYIQKNLIRQFVKDIVVEPESGIINCNFRKVPWIDDIINRGDIFGYDKIESSSLKKKSLRKTA